MREKYLSVFDEIWIDSLNGDKHETGKLTPDGKPDPSVFSTEFNREGIQVGTAISLLVRKETHTSTNSIHFREWWGTSKQGDLLATVENGMDRPYETLTPSLALGLPFMRLGSSEEYEKWPLLPAIFPASFPGVKTSRDDFLVDIDRDRLAERIGKYFDPETSNAKIEQISPASMKSGNRFDAEATRAFLLQRGFLPQNIVRFLYRPMDVRWLYWEPETKLLDEKRSDYFPQVFSGNMFFFTTGMTRKHTVEPALFTTVLNDLNSMDSGARGFPLYIRRFENNLFETNGIEVAANISEAALDYLKSLLCSEVDLFYHCLSMLHSSIYRNTNADGLRQNWPRIALPSTRGALLHSASLGRSIAALLDTEQVVNAVTSGAIVHPLRSIAVVSKAGGGALDPMEDLKLTVGWSHAGKGGATMPGRGKLVERYYTPEEQRSIEGGASLLDLSAEEVLTLLGESTCDVYLNEVAYWKNIPSRVWEYSIGGYHVIKKWLSYRELELLSRQLTPEEVREVMNMARRIAAIILLEPELDANYEAIKSAIYSWPAKSEE